MEVLSPDQQRESSRILLKQLMDRLIRTDPLRQLTAVDVDVNGAHYGPFTRSNPAELQKFADNLPDGSVSVTLTETVRITPAVPYIRLSDLHTTGMG